MKKHPLPKYMKAGTSDRILTKKEIKARFDQEAASVHSFAVYCAPAASARTSR